MAELTNNSTENLGLTEPGRPPMLRQADIRALAQRCMDRPETIGQDEVVKAGMAIVQLNEALRAIRTRALEHGSIKPDQLATFCDLVMGMR